MKKLVGHSIDFLLFSNAWVAFCLAGLVLGFAHYYCIDDCWLYALFAFSGTFAVYNFHRLVRNRTFQKEAIETERSRWQNTFRPLLVITCTVAILSAGILFFLLPVKPLSLILLGFSGAIVLFYAVPLPFIRKTLRQFSGFKNTWIVLVWVILISIPLINREKHIRLPDLILVAIFIYIQIVPFDIRDIPYDARVMKTLPQQLGISGSRLFASVLLACCIVFMIIYYPFQWLLPVTSVFSLAGLWFPQGTHANRYLELIWEGTLLSLGLYYYLLPCIQC